AHTEADPLIDSPVAPIDEACISFLSSISHEIRTPLNSAIGFTSLLSKTVLSEQQTQFLNYIKTSNEIIAKLINDIIDFSKIQSGNIEFSNNEVDLRNTVHEIFSIANILAFKLNIILTYAIDEKLKHNVIGDSLRLKQVLLNLMSIALKTFEERQPASNRRIKLETFIRYAENSYITTTFSIKTEKDASENYNAMENCEFSLLLSNMLVELMNKKSGDPTCGGCAITISRNQNNGINLSFQLSFKTGKSFFQAAEKTDRGIMRKKNSPGQKHTILIVDDDPVSLELVKIVLTSNGHFVSLAANGLEAVEAFKKNNFDIILMDSHMPILNGFEATAAIRKGGFTNPIIALTASVMSEDRESCLNAGMSGFIAKPIDPDIICSSIDDFIEINNQKNFSGLAPEIMKNYKTPIESESKTFNIEIFRRTVSGKSRLAKEIVKIFFDSYQKFMDEIRDSIMQINAEALWKAAHRMKGTAINVGAETMSALFGQLEEFGRKNYISGYQHILNSIIDEISKEYQKYRFEILSHPIITQTEPEF
ncbi:MAG TPA: response regulator, partial [Candidatus Wallbacteria bacterium]|nr:response regulator [Candidatus Wallbacteria bacterium]